MIKFVATVWRRPDLTPEQFTERWREGHAELMRRLAPTLKIVRYVQTHGIKDELLDNALAGRGWLSPPDGIAEVWWESHEAMIAALSTPEGQAANAALAADEAEFCDMSKMSGFLSREITVVG
ncbi:Ethyl tert-butyl ether degradation EthD [Sphingobium chlorophenolicum L-1]|uniref:Ethyl tert-butyl ether degradation EthD n=1 Tax=Sphingobium chlorophenolicum L-1 TaxID=690566 RepID=F6F206_SPHCR|nr:EthD domain-containing protein [Sphingobium chlorophenolicum]AEG51572.1 Ethyl tert-butyl ether degradation EthD [Sphingobium chlorophenolicum L-1]